MFFGWICVLLFIAGGNCLLMERLEVPSLAKLFGPLKLACRYRLGSFRLDSVKWYKDEQELFRFTPSERPQIRLFPVSGILIDISRSDMHIVTLANVSVTTAGIYRCEVSSDGPDFQTVQASMIMDVYYPPEGKPNVSINKTEIGANDYIDALCTSGKSYPAQKLLWFLNGKQASKKCIEREYTILDSNGLFRSYSRLKVQARGGPGTILVGCVGAMGRRQEPQVSHAQLTLESNKGSTVHKQNICIVIGLVRLGIVLFLQLK